jgi:hypothetical protein
MGLMTTAMESLMTTYRHHNHAIIQTTLVLVTVKRSAKVQ